MDDARCREPSLGMPLRFLQKRRADEEENPPRRYVRWDDLLKAFEGPPD
jgi:hypothetical protein